MSQDQEDEIDKQWLIEEETEYSESWSPASSSPLRGKSSWRNRSNPLLPATIIAFTVLFTFIIIRGIQKTSYIPPISRFPHSQLFDSIADWRLDVEREYAIKDWDYDAKPTTREYHWEITDILAAPDGVTRNMTVINGQFPGPLVQCNAGDTVKITIKNMGRDPTSVHFHGLFFINESYYDGAAYINQCEIPSGFEYTMEFNIDDEQYGTYWYHSHYSTQAADGLFGPVVIHSKREHDAIGDMYDEEMVVLLTDYYHDRGESYLAEYLGPANENSEPVPDNGLIQGANVFEMPQDYYKPGAFIPEESARYVFKFKADHKYRLRIINAGFFADLDFTIDNHPLTVIEADGTTVKPVTVDVMNIAVAQRYSAIINANVTTTEKNMFWLHAKFNEYCFDTLKPWFRYDARAVVIYVDPEEDEQVHGQLTKYVEPQSQEYQYYRDPFCQELDESLLHPYFYDPPPRNYDEHLRLDAWFHIGAHTLDRGQFNQSTYRPWKQSSSLYKLAFNMTESEDDKNLITKAWVPYEDNYIINVNKEGGVIDVLVNNLDDGAHPFHLHGYKFWIMKKGSGNFKFDHYDEIGKEFQATDDLEEGGSFIKRDTVAISGYKWAVIRFVADNPGVWPFHCHIGWHMEAGLLMQLNILQNQYREWEFPEQWKQLCQIQEEKYLLEH